MLTYPLWGEFFFLYYVDSFSSRDEDVNQTLLYSIKNDDSGQFRVDSQGNLYPAKNFDHESQNKHNISAVVTDSGNPSLKVIFLIRRTQVMIGHVTLSLFVGIRNLVSLLKFQ